MAQGGLKGVRAAFTAAQARIDRQAEVYDPEPDLPRTYRVGGKDQEFLTGEWPGGPVSRLPPNLPVVPLGVDGKKSYFIDTIGQLLDFDGLKRADLFTLFRRYPNTLVFWWPRYAAPKGKKGGPRVINGIEAEDAIQCLEKAAADRGLFSTADKVRGRGAWEDDHGQLIWHAGDRLFTVTNGKLQAADPGEVHGLFYPARPTTIEPWPEPVDHTDSPALAIFKALQTWSFGRKIDPFLVLGDIAVLMVGGALSWRPHMYVTGDMKAGKSALNRLLKSTMKGVLHNLQGRTSEAGVRQHMGLDTLPVALDELEPGEDNRRVLLIMELTRLASSGGRLYLGGGDHHGVEFFARNSFFLTSINPVPMKPQDRSRYAMLDLGKLKAVGDEPVIGEHDGRMLLRQIMDGWSDFKVKLADWMKVLRDAGLDTRAAETYGTLLAFANLLLGDAVMEEHGLPVTEASRLGEIVALATEAERGEQVENWRNMLEFVLGSALEGAWAGGNQPTIGEVIEQLERDEIGLKDARAKLVKAGLYVDEEPIEGEPGKRRILLGFPKQSPALNKIFASTSAPWRDGVWWNAVKQGVHDGVTRAETKVVKISRASTRCYLVDLAAYDAFVAGPPKPPPPDPVF